MLNSQTSPYGYRYHKLQKNISNFIADTYQVISKFNVGLKTLLHEGLSEPEFYGDLVYKFMKLICIGKNDFSFQFRKIITCYRCTGYNLNVMRQSACLVFNQSRLITFLNMLSLIARPVGQALDSMIALT